MAVSKEVRAQLDAREQRAEKAAADGAVAMADHKEMVRATDEKTARLKALRLATEAEKSVTGTGKKSPSRPSRRA